MSPGRTFYLRLLSRLLHVLIFIILPGGRLLLPAGVGVVPGSRSEGRRYTFLPLRIYSKYIVIICCERYSSS